MRTQWKRLTVAAIVLGVCGAYAQGAGNFDPSRDWQRRSAKMVLEMHTGLGVSERRARQDWDVAAEQRRLDLTNAAHERATQLCLVTEAYRQSGKDPNARQAYVQAAANAGQQYQQAVGTAYQAWANQVGQTFQQWQQTSSQSLQVSQNELGQAIQPFAQNMQAFEGEPAASMPSDWMLAASPGGDTAAAEKALVDGIEQARARYAAALNDAGAAWKKSVEQTAQQHANKEIADEVASGQFRKANRFWLATTMDALEELRAASRSALRKYEAAVTPD